MNRHVGSEKGCLVDGCCSGWCAGTYNLDAPQPDPGLSLCGAGAKDDDPVKGKGAG